MVSSDALMIFLGLDTTELDADLAVAQGRIDGIVQKWQSNRRDIMLGIGILNQSMMILTRLASKTSDEVGRAALRMLQSILTVVNSTVSAMVAVAAGYASTGVLAPIGAAIAAFAAGLSIGQAIEVAAAQAQVLANMDEVRDRLTAIETANTLWVSGGL